MKANIANNEQVSVKKHKSFAADFKAQVVGVYKSGVYANLDRCSWR